MNMATVFVEFGLIVLMLGMLARLALRYGFSPIPLYLLAGLLFGNGGVIPLDMPQSFIQIGAEIGVILLLFMLGLAYDGYELRSSLRIALPYGVLNVVLNFPPGLICGLLLGWQPLAALLLGGVTYATSSGIVAKTLIDLNWLGNRETPVLLSTLVLEDLSMAVYLPLVVVLLVGGTVLTGALSLSIAVGAVAIVLLIAINYGERLSRVIFSQSDEVVLLTTLGLILLVAGIAQSLQVSSAVGAFLVGIGLSGPVADRVRVLLTPLRDLFAATFFLFFSFQIDPSGIMPVLKQALVLGIVTLLSKFFTGYIAAARSGIGTRGRWRAGTLLIPRGEFSIVIAGLGASSGLAEPQLVPLTAAYVLLMAVIGPILAKVVDPAVAGVLRWRRHRREPDALEFR